MERGELCHDRCTGLLADYIQDVGAAKPNARQERDAPAFKCGVGGFNVNIFKKILLLLLLVSTLLVTVVSADGWHLSDYELHLQEPNQKAVISWDGETETMILSSAVKSNNISNFAWVIPIQSYAKPEVIAGNISIFEDLVRYFEKKEPVENIFKTECGSGVEVLESKEIDVYDITILKTTNSNNLINWLNENGYKVPKESKPILDKYVAKENCYFIANKIDLKNKFEEEINIIERIYSEKEQRYNQLYEDITAEFRKQGIANNIYEGSHGYQVFSEILALLGDYVNSEENPLELPLIYSEDLGLGLTVQERFGIAPFHESRLDKNSPKKLNYWDINNETRIISVLRDGEVVDVINYRSNKGCRTHRLYSESWVIKNSLEESEKFSDEEIELLCLYVDSRKNITISSEAKKETNEKLDAFANELNNALGTKIYEYDKLEGELYHYFYTFYESGRVVPNNNDKKILRENGQMIPLKVKINSVFYGPGLRGNISQSRFNDVYYATNDLQKGVGTPLKFEFKPYQPYYPLEISSLNIGESVIEVYVLADSDVIDKNNILTVEGSKKINRKLKGKLEKHVNLDNAEYVTKLSYKGELKCLNADAEFNSKGGGQLVGFYAKTPSFPDIQTRCSRHETRINNDSETTPTPNNFTTSSKEGCNFFQRVWSWICNLFGY